MKTRNLLLALGCAAALTACTTNDEPTVAPAPAMRAVTLTVDVNEPADTRVSYEKEGTTYKFSWSEGDQLYVYYHYDGVEEVEKFTIDNNSINGKSATFNGSLPDDYTGSVTIVYSRFNFEDLDESGTANYVRLSGYYGQTTDVASDLTNRTLLAATAKVTEAGVLPNVKLNHQLSYLLLKAGLQVTQAGLNVGEGDTELLLEVGAPGLISCSSTGIKAFGSNASGFGDIRVTDGKLVKDCLVPLFIGRESATNGYLVSAHFSGSEENGYEYQPNFTYYVGKIYVVEAADDTKWKPVTVPVPTTEPDEEPLTIEVLAAGTITIKNPLGLVISYQKNGGDKVTSTEGDKSDIVITVATSDKVQFFGDNETYSNGSDDTNIKCSAASKVYGNIMSLISSEGYKDVTSLPDGEINTFNGLFFENTGLIDASGLTLPATTLTEKCYFGMFGKCTSLTSAPEVLPAQTLTKDCYGWMFEDCTSLTIAPELKATTLAESCCSSMFQGCTSLTIAPELPAETLAKSCYENMFNGCEKLTTAPVLPATTLAEYCYSGMFRACKKLTTVPDLPAATLTEYCYSYMFDGCTSLVNAPELKATTLAMRCCDSMFYGCTSLKEAPELLATDMEYYCYDSMFNGCTSLTSAPVLSAQTLAEGCYANMFRNCSKLNSVTCLATYISADDCTNDWLNGVADSGTFVKPESMTSWTAGVSGIPSGWSVTAAP